MVQTLQISVQDVVYVLNARPAARPNVVRSFIQPEFRFTISQDVAWAPARSRAPSVIIDFDLSEAA